MTRNQLAGAPSAGALRTEHERLLAALKAARAGTWAWKIAEDIVEWDDALCGVYGIARERAPRTSSEFLALIHPDDRRRAWQKIDACIETGVDADYRFRAIVDGEIRWIYDRSSLVKNPDGSPAYMVGACLDVTDRQRIEAERNAALEKQTLLLNELGHRVKNHLAMIVSMLRLKGSRQTDPAARLDFERAIERVNTIAYLHGQLYRSGQVQTVDAQAYLGEICRNLEHSVLSESDIAIVCQLQPCALHVDQAVPIGLILNEFVTNAAKYAFAPGRSGRILVRFRVRNGRGTLTVSDNGRGFAPGTQPGVGSRLMRGLARQVGGRLRIVSANGLTCSLSFAVTPGEAGTSAGTEA
ncbi:sensor histidine kinase [Microbaculum marinum]|uniref:histidine kinase n=1 Tax=Microbaculum marinum TaxID=1764581 RepID=A0AAW9RI89_9HYPH